MLISILQSLVKIPESLTYEEASTLPYAFLVGPPMKICWDHVFLSCAGVTAYNALNGPRLVKAGDTVLVLGTGGVSTLVFHPSTRAFWLNPCIAVSAFNSRRRPGQW